MDEYTRECIKWLIENDRELLTHHLNTVCGSSAVSFSNIDEVEKMILNATAGNKKEENGIKCKNCGKNTVTFLEVQTRSADEGASVFYSCTNCLVQWKQR